MDKAGIKKSLTTLGEIVGLHNCAVADKGSIEEYNRNLDKAGIKIIARLHNCAVADITPQLWHDVTPQQRLKCKEMDGGTNVMITYDEIKIDGAYSDGIINNTPLFHQMFVNI